MRITYLALLTAINTYAYASAEEPDSSPPLTKKKRALNAWNDWSKPTKKPVSAWTGKWSWDGNQWNWSWGGGWGPKPTEKPTSWDSSWSSGKGPTPTYWVTNGWEGGDAWAGNGWGSKKPAVTPTPWPSSGPSVSANPSDTPSDKPSLGPSKKTICPCFEKEDLSVITAANVSEESCDLSPNPVPHFGGQLYLSNQDGSASFVSITPPVNEMDKTSCSVNGQDLLITPDERNVCESLLISKCEEIFTCPCFDQEALSVITAANVSEDSCAPISSQTETGATVTNFSVSNQDGSASFGSKTLIFQRPSSIQEYYCTADGQEETVIDDSRDFEACNKLIRTHCAVVKPLICPCFDEEALSVITAANVSEDSCVRTFTETGDTFSVSDEDGNSSFGVARTYSPEEFSCNFSGEEETISSKEYLFCNGLVQSHCDEVKPPACPCFDEEDLEAVTADSVAEEACQHFVEGGGSERFVLFNDDDSASFEFLASPAEFQCSGRDESSGVNTNEIFSNVIDAGECMSLISNHCGDIGKPIETIYACPCFDEEDLLAVTADNVAEGACKLQETNEINTLVLFNQGQSASFTLTSTNPVPEVEEQFVQCSGRDESGLNKEETFFDLSTRQRCDDLITNRCEDIGKPIEVV